MDDPDDPDESDTDGPEFPWLMVFPIIAWAAHALLCVVLIVWLFALITGMGCGGMCLGFCGMAMLGPLASILARGSQALLRGEWEAEICFIATFPTIMILFLSAKGFEGEPVATACIASAVTLIVSDVFYLVSLPAWRRWAGPRSRQSL